MCRDKSYLVIKECKAIEKGAIITSSIQNKTVYQIVNTFVDDANFYSNRNNIEQNINNILEKYIKLYSATGGLIQKEKSYFYYWKWSSKNNTLKSEDYKGEIKINKGTIKQFNNNQRIQVLGVYMNPVL